MDQTHVDVGGVGDLIVVQNTVLGASTVHPDWSLLGLDENTTTVEDVDLVVISHIELVVRDPEPIVFEIGCRLGSNMQEQESTFTVRVGSCGGSRILGAFIRLEFSSSSTADSEVNVPHARSTLR